MITRLWHELEKNAKRKAEAQEIKRRLRVVLSILLIAPFGVLMPLK